MWNIAQTDLKTYGSLSTGLKALFTEVSYVPTLLEVNICCHASESPVSWLAFSIELLLSFFFFFFVAMAMPYESAGVTVAEVLGLTLAFGGVSFHISLTARSCLSEKPNEKMGVGGGGSLFVLGKTHYLMFPSSTLTPTRKGCVNMAPLLYYHPATFTPVHKPKTFN